MYGHLLSLPNEDGYSGSGMWGMDWIGLAQDRGRWWEIVNAVINLQVQ
jgi:hypothetical protein